MLAISYTASQSGCRVPGGRPVVAAPDAFAIAVRNLVGNALRHGARDSPVPILRDEGGIVHVCIAGGQLDAAALARLGQPFVGRATTADGSGPASPSPAPFSSWAGQIVSGFGR